MQLFSPDNLVLGLIILVPGFIATLIATTVGVVEQEIRSTELVMVSLTSSLIIDSAFLGVVEFIGVRIRSPTAIKSVFFTPDFRPGLVLILIFLSILFGGIYTFILVFDLPQKTRRWAWKQNDRVRLPWQPWEGAMKDAYMLHVQTEDEGAVVGVLDEYSRAGKNRQLLLKDAIWENQDGEEPKSSKELLFEDQIKRVSVMMTEEERKSHSEE